MISRLQLIVLLVVAGHFACATKKVAIPPPRTFQLGEQSATYRDLRDSDPCRMDPAVLRPEFDGQKILLAEFLGQTSGGYDGVWSDAHLAVLSTAQSVLPPVLASADSATNQILRKHCLGDELEATARDLNEMARQSKKRLEEAPTLVPYVLAKRELSRWKEAQPAARQTAKKKGCTKKAKSPVAYYAAEDEKAVITYLFCDGIQATKELGGVVKVLPDKPGRQVSPTAYEAVVEKFPPAEIVRAPRMPVRSVRRSVEETDTFDLNKSEL